MVAEQEKDNDSPTANTTKNGDHQVETDKVLVKDKMWHFLFFSLHILFIQVANIGEHSVEALQDMATSSTCPKVGQVIYFFSSSARKIFLF